MKIRTTTVREIDDSDYWNWVKAVNMGNPLHPIDGKKLLKTRKEEHSSFDMVEGGRSTIATTTYEILETTYEIERDQ
jgi:hypothetical protein